MAVAGQGVPGSWLWQGEGVNPTTPKRKSPMPSPPLLSLLSPPGPITGAPREETALPKASCTPAPRTETPHATPTPP
jgi:hypothetical protein